MKKRKTASGLMLTGSFRQSGVTIYQRNGKIGYTYGYIGRKAQQYAWAV
jgi:hypothetical protein